MYSWIASWFTGADADTGGSEYIKQEQTTDKEDWTWVEMITEQNSDGYVYVQSTRRDLNQTADNPKPQCVRRKRSFSADIHDKARKRARVTMSSRSSYDFFYPCSPTTRLDLPVSLFPHRRPVCILKSRPLEVSEGGHSIAPLTVAIRYNHINLFPLTVSEILSQSFTQSDRDRCRYPDMDFGMKYVHPEPQLIGFHALKQLLDALNTARQDSDDRSSAFEVPIGRRKPLLSICWRDSDNLSGEISPKATRHRIPSWLRRISPDCVEYEHDGLPHWMSHLRLVDEADEALGKTRKMTTHDLPQWMKDINVFDEGALHGEESFHFMPLWMRQIDIGDARSSLENILNIHSSLSNTSFGSRNEPRFLKRFPSWMSESDLGEVLYDAIFPHRLCKSDDLFVVGSPWDYEEAAAEGRVSDFAPRNMEIVPYGCRALLSRGCRDLVPIESRHLIIKLSEYCRNMLDMAVILTACTMCIRATESSACISPVSAEIPPGLSVDATKTQRRTSAVSRKLEKRFCNATPPSKHRQRPVSKKSMIRSNRVIMNGGKNQRKSRFFNPQRFSGGKSVRAC